MAAPRLAISFVLLVAVLVACAVVPRGHAARINAAIATGRTARAGIAARREGSGAGLLPLDGILRGARDWWAHQRLVRCRRAGLAPDPRLGLPDELIDLIAEFMSVRCYLVAALSRPDIASVIVWEVAVDVRVRGRGHAHAELLRVFKLSLSSRSQDAFIDRIAFLPDSDTLVGNFFVEDIDAEDGSFFGAVLWDARSGVELLRIRDTEVIAVPARGDTFLGKGDDADGVKVTLWNATSGRAVQTLRPGLGFDGTRRRIQAAMSPDGDLVALLSQVFFETRFVVEVWNASTGERWCSLEVVHSGEPLRGHYDFAFDGSKIAICRIRPGVLLSVVGRGSSCELVHNEPPERCDATHLPTGAQLQIALAWAKVTGVGANSTHARHFAPLRRILNRHWEGMTNGKFAPDGLSVALSRLGESHHIWALGRGRPPRAVCERPSSYPVFSADSGLLAIICGNHEVVLCDADGDELLRLTQGPEVALREIAVTDHRP